MAEKPTTSESTLLFSGLSLLQHQTHLEGVFIFDVQRSSFHPVGVQASMNTQMQRSLSRAAESSRRPPVVGGGMIILSFSSQV